MAGNNITIDATINGQTIALQIPPIVGVEITPNPIPYIQQTSDWLSSTNPTQILNKPTIPVVPITTNLDDVQVGSGIGTWITKTLAQFKTILGLGTAAFLNVPVIGNASSSEVVKGSDTRLSGNVPLTRTITTTSPLLIDNQPSADLSTDRTLSIPASTASVNGYATSTQITKLDGIATGAEVNVQSDWDALSGDAFILNKPSIPTQYTDELAQDAVGGILTNTGNVQFSYDDATPKITASVDISGKQDTLQSGTNIKTINSSSILASGNLNLEPSLGFTPENVSNKSTTTSLGTSDTLYPTQNAVKQYVDSVASGVLSYRGAYDASTNLFPSTGGSGVLGAIMKGNMWIISVAGTLGGNAVFVGDSIIANVDTPGQTAGNWNIISGAISYTPEDVANKSSNVSLGTSDVLYPTQNATKSYVDTGLGTKQNTGSYEVTSNKSIDSNLGSSDSLYVSQKAIKGYVDTSLTSKQNLDSTLTALAGLDSSLGFVQQTATDTFTKNSNVLLSSTGLSLDQTVQQTVLNGSPIFNGGAQVNSFLKLMGLRFTPTLVTGNYTVQTTDWLIICNSTSPISIFLLPSLGNGQTYKIKNINTGAVTVYGDTTGTPDLIDGDATFPMIQWDLYEFSDYAVNKWAVS
jgi:hypothetical protein